MVLIYTVHQNQELVKELFAYYLGKESLVYLSNELKKT